MTSPRLVLTQHALERMRERVLPSATLDECRTELERRWPRAHRVPRAHGRGRLYYLAGDPPACCVVIPEKGACVVVTVGGWDERLTREVEAEAAVLGWKPVPDDLRAQVAQMRSLLSSQAHIIEGLTRDKMRLETAAARALKSRDEHIARCQEQERELVKLRRKVGV